ncbi:hypothetical protein MMC28_000190 [Mycoblastus sanguinarius]|nr:hypothetical protein [Mycoblastus sanguinarius]
MGVSYHTPDACGQSPTSRQWKVDRKFLPLEIYGPGFDLDSTEWEFGSTTMVPCPREEHRCKNCGTLSSHVGALIVAIDGACRGNGTARAQSAVGVFFGTDSPYNIGALLTKPTPTSQKAELEACLAALDTLLSIKVENTESDVSFEDLGQVIIKADSEYVVKGMTEWIFKWRKNGYRNAKGLPVTNAILFQQADATIFELNNLGVEVLFWRVLRSRNQEADALANSAFDGI